MTDTCISRALNAVNKAADIVAGRLQCDLDSLYQQVDEIEVMSRSDVLTDEEKVFLVELRRKIKALDPNCSEHGLGRIAPLKLL